MICLLGTTSLHCGDLNLYLRNLSADSVSNVLLIDKSKQSLFVVRSNLPGNVQALDSFRISTGKVDGNKEVEGDHKTPEGIYDIIATISGNQLPAKYGPLAFVLNYPNHIDRIYGRNGSNIWIHGRDEEIVDRQTEGCVSLENGKLLLLSDFIQLNKTPVIIIDRLDHSGGSPEVLRFTFTDSLFNNWLNYWNTGDIESYAKYYSPYFKSQSQTDRTQHLTTKKQLEQIYNWKKVSADQVWLLQSDHEARINFQQEYLCPKFYSRGYKQLVLMWSDSCWQIVDENFSALIPRIYTEPVLRSFLKSWETAWEAADSLQYISHYDSSFASSQYSSLNDWYSYKRALFSRAHHINISISDIRITSPTEYQWIVSFQQDYTSDNYRDRGRKTLYITGHPKDPGTFKIINETWKEIK